MEDSEPPIDRPRKNGAHLNCYFTAGREISYFLAEHIINVFSPGNNVIDSGKEVRIELPRDEPYLKDIIVRTGNPANVRFEMRVNKSFWSLGAGDYVPIRAQQFFMTRFNHALKRHN